MASIGAQHNVSTAHLFVVLLVGPHGSELLFFQDLHEALLQALAHQHLQQWLHLHRMSFFMLISFLLSAFELHRKLYDNNNIKNSCEDTDDDDDNVAPGTCPLAPPAMGPSTQSQLHEAMLACLAALAKTLAVGTKRQTIVNSLTICVRHVDCQATNHGTAYP